MKPVTDSKDLFRGALILTIAAFITKVLSAIYRVPFQNIVGDIGFYIYQQVYPFYGIALILSTYGFPMVISKLYAERKKTLDDEGARRLILLSYLILTTIGLILFSAVYLGSDWIAIQMNDPQLAIPLKAVALVFLIVPFSSVLRGYFQGNGNMMPTAISQVGEQFIRVVTILAIAFLFVSTGESLYKVGAGAMLGAVTGGIIAIILLIIFFIRRKDHKGKKKHQLFQLQSVKESKTIVKALLIQGLAVSISGMLLIIIQMADSLTLYALLTSSGVGENAAKELKGVYDRGQPLIQLGMIVATSLSLAIVPVISSERARNNNQFLSEKVRLAFQISIIIGAGAAFGLFSIMKPTNLMLFENTTGSTVLSILSMLVLLSSFIITISSVLQGLGNTLFPATIILIGFMLKYIFNLILVPSYSTVGAAGASIISLLIVSAVLAIKLKRTISISLLPKRFMFVVFLASVVMVAFLQLYIYLTNPLYQLTDMDRVTASFQALSGSVLGGLIYIWIILRGKVLKEEDLTSIPFGSKLLYLMPKENRSR